MTRVKRGVTALKRRRNILKRVKGFRFGRGTKEIEAKTALLHAGSHAFAHRRDKKSDRRRLWQVKINAALRPLGYSYSKFIGALTKKSIGVDLKILGDMTEHNPSSFERVVKSL